MGCSQYQDCKYPVVSSRSCSAVRQLLYFLTKDQTWNPEEGTESLQAHGTFVYSLLFHPLSLLASAALLPPPDLVSFYIIMTPGLAVGTASGRAHPDENTK